MRIIYKYKIKSIVDIYDGNLDRYELIIPSGSKILSCAIQRNSDVCVWVEQDFVTTEKTTMEHYAIEFAGTGWPLHNMEKYNFLNTILVDDGEYVYHVYYRLLP